MPGFCAGTAEISGAANKSSFEACLACAIVAIDQYFPSSKRCSCCGFTMNKMLLDVRKWVCSECGEAHERDINAVRNIKAAGWQC